MTVLAANITNHTKELLEKTLKTDKFVKFSLQNRVDLNDYTVLIRFALINLAKNLPSNEEFMQYKASLLRPNEFDDFWKNELKIVV